LRMLAFPNGFFDLVNLRCGSSFVRTWEWPKLLEEMRRVCRPDGVLRLTEPAILTHSSSPALLHLNALLPNASNPYYREYSRAARMYLRPLCCCDFLAKVSYC
jgi:ubiquinone/menaquinone biosynthesis C-methylase UbiE